MKHFLSLVLLLSGISSSGFCAPLTIGGVDIDDQNILTIEPAYSDGIVNRCTDNWFSNWIIGSRIYFVEPVNEHGFLVSDLRPLELLQELAKNNLELAWGFVYVEGILISPVVKLEDLNGHTAIHVKLLTPETPFAVEGIFKDTLITHKNGHTFRTWISFEEFERVFKAQRRNGIAIHEQSCSVM